MLNLDFQMYDRLVILDTNIFFHFQPIQNIPWQKIVDGDRILLVILPQVAHEIEKRKRDSRLADRSRKLHKIFTEIIQTGAPLKVGHVEVALLSRILVDWEDLELDREEFDHRIVGQMLSIKDCPSERIVFIGYDATPIALAKSFGVNAMFLSDEYLLQPEPSPAEVKLGEATRRIRELEDARPKFEISVQLEKLWASPAVLIVDDGNVDFDELARTSRIYQPRESFPPGLSARYDATELREYNDALVERAHLLPRRIEQVLNQFLLRVLISNAGSVRGENVRISVNCQGARIWEKPILPEVWPPRPPSLQAPHLLNTALIQAASRSLRHNDPYSLDVDFDSSCDGLVLCSVESFDTKSEHECRLFLGIDSTLNGPLSIEVEVTAANHVGRRHHHESHEISFEEMPLGEALCPENQKIFVPREMKEFLNREIKDKLDLRKFGYLDERID